MKKNKKILLILLLPFALTMYFVFWVLVPTIQNYNNLSQKVQQTEETYEQTFAQVEKLKNNKMLLEEIEELNQTISDFEVQLPSEFEDEFLLVDLSTFSMDTKTKINSLSAKTEKALEIKKEEKRRTSRRRVKEDDPVLPLNVYEKPFEFKIVGKYNDSIAFVNMLENYQRKFIISSVSAQISKNDEKNPNPKIELTIDGSSYKAIKNPLFFQPEPEEDTEE